MWWSRLDDVKMLQVRHREVARVCALTLGNGLDGMRTGCYHDTQSSANGSALFWSYDTRFNAISSANVGVSVGW